MRIITMECPRCGAKLEVDADIDFVMCEYCDSMLKVNIRDDELSEDARQRSKEKKADALAEKIREYIPVINELAEQNERVRDLTNEKERLADRMSTIGKKKLMKLPEKRIAGGVLAGLVLLALIIRNVRGLFILLTIAWVGYYLYARNYNKQLRRDYIHVRDNYESLVELLEQTEERVREIRENYDFSFIPKAYRKESIMKYMASMLERRRAYNIPEAIERYEEHRIREKEERYHSEQLRLQRQQIELQQRQLNNAQNAQYSTPNANNSNGNGKGLEYAAAAVGALAVGAKVAKELKKWM